MRFTISRRELFDQLPKELRYGLIRDYADLPVSFTFDALVDGPTLREKLEAEFPIIKHAFTGLERLVMAECSAPDGCLVQRLGSKYLHPKETTSYRNYANGVAVHAKNIRIKLKFYGLPFVLATRRSTFRMGDGRYVLERTGPDMHTHPHAA